MLTYITAGESHGPAMTAIVDGFPAGLEIDVEAINRELKRRQGGYGRGQRQALEQDQVDLLSGVWNGVTLGSPICLQIKNADFKLPRLSELPRPRPGHGDLSGAIKYLGSIRGVLERASARETAARVAAGALASQLLAQFGIHSIGFVLSIGTVRAEPKTELLPPQGSILKMVAERDRSIVYSLNTAMDEQFKLAIDAAEQAGDTLGGIVETQVHGVPFGLGTHTQWQRKLDGRLAQAVMSIQAVKGVEIGLGFEAARRPGSQVHDPIQYDQSTAETPQLGYTRPSNHAGGLEAGMTNGQPIIVRAAKKPISTLRQPLESINMETKEPQKASYERSDVCAVPAASVIVQHVVAFEVAAALVEKFGGDSLMEMQARWETFQKLARQR